MLKHTEENIKEQGIKQGVKSAMAWRVSKVKPRCPNGQCSGSFIRGFVACFIDHMLDIIIILLLIYFAVARGRKRKQDSVDTLVSPMVWIFLSFFSRFQVSFYCFLISFCLIVFCCLLDTGGEFGCYRQPFNFQYPVSVEEATHRRL